MKNTLKYVSLCYQLGATYAQEILEEEPALVTEEIVVEPELVPEPETQNNNMIYIGVAVGLLGIGLMIKLSTKEVKQMTMGDIDKKPRARIIRTKAEETTNPSKVEEP